MAAIPHVSLAAEVIFHMGPLPVTNSLVNAFVALVLTSLVALIVYFTKLRLVPGRWQNALEMIIERLLEFFDQVTGDREKSKKFFPLVGTLFIFILFSNWLGLLPGTGSIGVWHRTAEGVREFIPLLRPATSDLNLTMAMAVMAVVSSHVFAVRELGLWSHIGKFFPLGNLWRAITSLNIVKVFVSLIEFVVGIIEFFSEFAKIASLSLRLFGNIFAGEVLITVISSLVAFLVPLPFMGLELLVGVIQAGVFATLTTVYLTVATSAPHGHEEEHPAAAHPEPVLAAAHA
jgi:F-type H+-transporting ATPase subunit a